jgi:regulator of replication initiation timing
VRNVDKIRVLENQLEHERNQVARLREENTTLHTANTQIRQMTDAVITEM